VSVLYAGRVPADPDYPVPTHQLSERDIALRFGSAIQSHQSALREDSHYLITLAEQASEAVKLSEENHDG
jgi:hypothetical protein